MLAITRAAARLHRGQTRPRAGPRTRALGGAVPSCGLGARGLLDVDRSPAAGADGVRAAVAVARRDGRSHRPAEPRDHHRRRGPRAREHGRAEGGGRPRPRGARRPRGRGRRGARAHRSRPHGLLHHRLDRPLARDHDGGGAAGGHRRGGRRAAALPRVRRVGGAPGRQHGPRRRRHAARQRAGAVAHPPAGHRGRRSGHGPGHPRCGRHHRHRGQRARGRWLDPGRRPGVTGLGHRGRGSRHRRGRPAGPALGLDAASGRRRGGGAGRRLRGVAAGRPPEGQRRLPPARPAVRQRGHAGGHHPGPPGAGADRRPPGDRAPGPRVARRRGGGRRMRCAAPSPELDLAEVMLPTASSW